MRLLKTNSILNLYNSYILNNKDYKIPKVLPWLTGIIILLGIIGIAFLDFNTNSNFLLNLKISVKNTIINKMLFCVFILIKVFLLIILVNSKEIILQIKVFILVYIDIIKEEFHNKNFIILYLHLRILFLLITLIISLLKFSIDPSIINLDNIYNINSFTEREFTPIPSRPWTRVHPNWTGIWGNSMVIGNMVNRSKAAVIGILCSFDNIKIEELFVTTQSIQVIRELPISHPEILSPNLFAKLIESYGPLGNNPHYSNYALNHLNNNTPLTAFEQKYLRQQLIASNQWPLGTNPWPRWEP